MKKVTYSVLPCPEVWIDPEILPLITLLNKLGLETTWSCAGFGPSRTGVEQPLSRFPAKVRRNIKKYDEHYYIEEKVHFHMACPYVVVKTSTLPPWIDGVLKHLKKASIENSDLYTDRFLSYGKTLMVDMETFPEGDMKISMARECLYIIDSIANIPVCKEDIVTIKKMWVHEMVKAFSFI